MTKTAEICLPPHMEERRERILSAMKDYREMIMARHADVIGAINEMNQAIMLFNRVLDHADGWTIEAAEVIACEFMAPAPVSVSPSIVRWRAEIDASDFDRLSGINLLEAPAMPQVEEFEALPRYPDRDNG